MFRAAPPSRALEERLSAPQFRAATFVDKPVCILAGAGSGKTRVVTHRIAYLIDDCGERPWSILAVTFTNKAAKEMRERVDVICPGVGRDVRIGTFHGTAARWLRQFGAAVGVQPNYVIYDSDDAERLLKRIVVDEFGETRDLVRPIKYLIEGWQSDGLGPDDLKEYSWSGLEKSAREAFALYLERLTQMNAIDFNGLLVKVRDLLLVPAGREIRRRVKHLLVDEYQDTNAVQAQITLELAKTAETVAVVGDDDQAIYGWRGASADNLQHFLQSSEGTELVRLEDNYRSTRTILEAANGVIAHNEERLGKVLRATGEVGQKIRVIKAQNDIDEARRVVASMQEHVRRQKPLEDLCVLYRANALSRPFEDELRKARLPYRVIGGVRFYDRKEVKDVLATVRAALNIKSDVDALRCITSVPRGIGQGSLDKIQAAALAKNLSLLEAMGDESLMDSAGLQKRIIKKALEFSKKMSLLGDKIGGTNATRPEGGQSLIGQGDAKRSHVDAQKAIALAIEVSGISNRLEAEGTLESEGRLENLSELLSAAAQHTEDAQREKSDDSIAAFLENASLTSGTDSEESDSDEAQKVTMMTLHAAKGLEFPHVYLVGLEEHGFPHSRSISDDAAPESLEEERRLAYVGITRARERLTLSFAQRRMVHGQIRPRRVSRFLSEIPRDALTGDSIGRVGLSFSTGFLGDGEAYLSNVSEGSVPSDARQKRGAFVSGFARIKERTQREVFVDESESVAAEVKNTSGLERGDRVSHKAFGDGVVVEMRHSARRPAAMVRFDGGRAPRVIIAEHLTKVEIADGEVVMVLEPEYSYE